MFNKKYKICFLLNISAIYLYYILYPYCVYSGLNSTLIIVPDSTVIPASGYWLNAKPLPLIFSLKPKLFKIIFVSLMVLPLKSGISTEEGMFSLGFVYKSTMDFSGIFAIWFWKHIYNCSIFIRIIFRLRVKL